MARLTSITPLPCLANLGAFQCWPQVTKELSFLAKRGRGVLLVTQGMSISSHRALLVTWAWKKWIEKFIYWIFVIQLLNYSILVIELLNYWNYACTPSVFEFAAPIWHCTCVYENLKLTYPTLSVSKDSTHISRGCYVPQISAWYFPYKFFGKGFKICWLRVILILLNVPFGGISTHCYEYLYNI